MQNFRPDGESAQIPVSLTIEQRADGSYSLRTVFNRDETNGLRDYLLIPGDAPGRFILDEQNGIWLKAVMIGGELVSAFTVASRALISRYRLSSDAELVHEVTFWDEEDVLESSGTGVSGENGEPVLSWGIEGTQRSTFRRVDSTSPDG